MFLAGYGGMVSLMQLTIAGFAGYMDAIFGVNGDANISLGWPWWLATPDGAGARDVVRRDRRRARGAHRGHLHDHDHARDRARRSIYFTNQNYAIFNGHTGINSDRDAAFLGRRLARRDSVLLSDARRRRRSAIARSTISRARRSGWRCRACATIRAAWRRSASTSTRTASPPMPSPPSSPRSAAFCRSGATARSRRARSASTRAIDILIIAVVGGITRPDRAVHRRPDLRACCAPSRSISCVAIGLDGNRFRLLIGLGFLVIVFLSPDGVIGLWERWRDRARVGRSAPADGGGHG